MTRDQLLTRLEMAWADFTSSYSGLSHSELTLPGVTGNWSIKDIIAHVSTWEEETLKHLPVILKGDRTPLYSVAHGGIDAFNAKTSMENAELSLPQVLSRQAKAHRKLITLITRVPERQIKSETRFRKRLRVDTYGHYPIHTRAIRAWREKRGRDQE